MPIATVEDLTERIWSEIGDDHGLVAAVTYTGPEQVLPAVFDVTSLAAATVGAATSAAAELLAARRREAIRPVHVDRRASSVAFLSELLFTPEGWSRPAVWDPIAGDYPGRDGWVKLHTNYRSHRTAVEAVLGPLRDRDAAAAAVSSWSVEELQDAVVAAGGAAAAMNGRERWLASPAGAAAAGEAISRIAARPGVVAPSLSPSPDVLMPLAGVRVLDLTRVIAGPVCTRFLAAYGADVLRVDPPGFEEVGALLPITTEGKHCTALDLTRSSDRVVFDALLGDAHVFVSGLRPGALEHLGYGDADLHSRYPHLITASLDAYGWSGPWSGRRGFDSLVQMSSGIAAAGGAARGEDRPIPLPAQALDHGTGYILAGAVCRALTRLINASGSTEIRSSLVGTANLLAELPTPDGLETTIPDLSDAATVPVDTAWGPARRVPLPGSIRGAEPRLTVAAGPLGRHAPRWVTPVP